MSVAKNFCKDPNGTILGSSGRVRPGLSLTTAGSYQQIWPIRILETTRSDTRLSRGVCLSGSGQNVATHPVAQLKQQDIPDAKPLQQLHRSLSPRTHPFHTTYDDKGRLNELNVWDSARVWQFQKIALYADKTVTWNTYGARHRLTSREILVYDEKGQLIKEDSFNPGDPEPVFSTTYAFKDFDSAGNWTKRIVKTKLSSADDVESVEYRAITYYK